VSVLAGADLRFTRGGNAILDGVSVSVAAGEVLAVAGPSGAGKSSLLALLAGLEHPDEGTVRWNGAALTGVPERFGVVLQGFGLVNLLTAAENVEMALQARRVAPGEVRRRAADALAEVGLAHVHDHLIEELSGGQQQRVAIARALVTDPDVIVADEITAELDAATRDRVVELLLARADAGATVVLATHDPGLMARCDRAVELYDGRLAP
jgi:heme ABC exporter ATP-binding subunit CcmA